MSGTRYRTIVLIQGIFYLLVMGCLLGEEKPIINNESLIFLGADGQVYQAKFANNAVNLKQISSPDQSILKLSANSKGKMVWVNNNRQKENKKGHSYVDLEIRFLNKQRRPTINGDILLSPCGEMLAYVVYDKSGYKLYHENLNTGNIQVLSEQKVILSPSWSPDSKMIAYYCGMDDKPRLNGGEGLMLYIVDIKSGKSKQMTEPSKRMGVGFVHPNRPVWYKTSKKLIFEAKFENDSELRCVYEVAIENKAKPVRLTAGICASMSIDNEVIYVSNNGI